MKNKKRMAKEVEKTTRIPMSNITRDDEDFPVYPKKIVHLDHQTSSDLFEFLSDPSCEMSHAEDIFLCGKLLPLQQQPPPPPPQSPRNDDNMLHAFHQRRCESFSEQNSSDQWNSSPRKLRRNSKSLDYRHMKRDSSINNNGIPRLSPQNRSPNNKRKSIGILYQGDNVEEVKVSKPRWYTMLFGLLTKIPNQEMDLQDIKIRQTRRKNQIEGIQNGTGKTSWGMLNVLSCKSSASIVVASTG